MSSAAQRFFDSVPGSRPLVLESEYGDDGPKFNGAKWVRDLGWVVDLDEVDPNGWVAPYVPRPYSRAAIFNAIFAGHDFSGDPSEEGDGRYVLRDDQQQLSEQLLDVYQDGRPGFLNASDTGTGKTITTVSALKRTGARNILVVSPKSVIPSWRSTLETAGDGGKMWLLINYQSMRKLLLPSASEKEAKRAATKNRRRAESGLHLFNWDIIVFDECHYLANHDTLQSKIARRLVEGDGSVDPAFQVWLSATYAVDPTKATYLWPSLVDMGASKPDTNFTVARYASGLRRLGVNGVTENGKGGLTEFSGSPRDIKKFSNLVFTGDQSFGDRIESPDDQHRELLAVDLTRQEMVEYEGLWAEFVEQYQSYLLGLDPERRKTAHKEPQGLAVQIRFRQKAGLLRAPYMVDAIRDRLTDGHQVAVSCEFAASVERVMECMEDAKMSRPAVFTGENTKTRESERLAFQRGEKQVILFSVAEGINLQANEIDAGTPSSAPRSLLIAEPRWSPLKMSQIEGRTQRNGEVSTAYYAYASGTIEHRVLTRMLSGMEKIGAMRGDALTADSKADLLRELRGEVLAEVLASSVK